jgi:hypothetical protein
VSQDARVFELATTASLTYMSIRNRIAYWCEEAHQELFQILPRLPDTKVVRFLFGTWEINRLIEGPWVDEKEEVRCGRLWEDFDRFVEGRLISVSLDTPYKKPKSTYLARLDPGRDEVWEIRSRFPKRGIRVFGRFAERNTLILLNWEYRERLGGPGSPEFIIEMRKCKAEWRKLFPTYGAHTGDTVNEYVSEKILPV